MSPATENGAVRAPQRLVHEALMYRDSDALGDRIGAFAEAAAQADEPVLAVLPAGHLPVAQRACGTHAERVRWATMDDVGRNPSRLLALYVDWIAEHSGRVRILSEPVWAGRERSEAVECLRHEALVNHELAEADATLLCPYDAARLDPEILVGAEMTHPRLLDDDGRGRESPRYEEPLTVARGEHWPLAEPREPVCELRFAGDLGSLRRAVAGNEHAAALGRRLDDLVFAVGEAASNALKHADGTCVARLWSEASGVVSEVSTRSALSDACAGRRRPRWDAEDGRGLWLINQVCDLVELRSQAGRTVLRMHVRRPA